MSLIFAQDPNKSRQQKRLEQEQEKGHMEKEMNEALMAMQERDAIKEAQRKLHGSSKIRIATPGAKVPGTPKHTPKRFGL
jgi:pre-mRNA-splicing factor ATP-dependent RNA helicase DHX38/PRP16